MAKGALFISTFQGKLGNIVGYTLKDSNDKVVQATRVYQPNVANPKTEPQAIQRMKLAPAVNFYRQLSRILDNAWQGQRYGNRSRQFFMSLAMKQSTGIPFIIKGDKRFYPGEYQVSQGSLVSVVVSAIATDLLTTSLISGGLTGTWGAVSQGIINKNFGIKNGDKLTFIFIGKNSFDEYVPAFSYVILDTTSTSTAESIIASSNLSFTGAVDAPLQVGVINAVSNIVAGAVIVSRLDNVSGTTWQRSNSTIFCTDEYKEIMMGVSAYQAAISSYTEDTGVSSNWYLNQGITGDASVYYPGGNSGSNLTIVSVSNIYFTHSSAQVRVAVAVMSDGTHRALRSNSSPTNIVRLENNAYFNTGLSATTTVLTEIQETDPLVSGWLVVNTSPNDENEQPEVG